MQRRAVQPPGAFTVPTAVPIGAVLLAVWMLSNARPDELVLQAVVIVAAVALAIGRRRALSHARPELEVHGLTYDPALADALIL